MTRTDLRLAYKMDTGDYPLWKENHDGKDIGWMERDLQKGYPRTDYGLWLEEKTGKQRYLRDRYYKLHSETPCRSYFQPGYGYETLFGDYIEWLESFVLKFKPEIVSNIIKVD